ncbi:MAG: GNAT family N-acetyltransferase [Schleiferiaceae bacterium]|jgi:GNAT superfamily N-acetyltransferase|nr:GNAT family N-acetyltransferase [Schleiferiaceae bacterium]MDP4859028.1 GNAT family N-acetyltransferase [Schleiferiaceae bacterium]
MYTVRSLTPLDFNHLNGLYAASFGTNFTEINFQEKYFQDGALNAVGMLALDPNGQPAAYYGVFKCTLVFDGTTYLAAQSGDTMTHPNHQKRGLFTLLARAVFEECKKQSIALVFGFPNAQSYPGFVHKLNWNFAGNMCRWVLQTGGLPLCELASKFPSAQGTYQRFARQKLTPFSSPSAPQDPTPFEPFGARGFLGRSPQQWESLAAQTGVHVVQINGWELLIKLENHLIVGAVGYRSAADTASLFSAIKQLAKRVGASKAVLMFSPNHWLTPLLNAELPCSEGLPIGFLNLTSSALDFSEVAISYSDFDTF